MRAFAVVLARSVVESARKPYATFRAKCGVFDAIPFFFTRAYAGSIPFETYQLCSPPIPSLLVSLCPTLPSCPSRLSPQAVAAKSMIAQLSPPRSDAFVLTDLSSKWDQAASGPRSSQGIGSLLLDFARAQRVCQLLAELAGLLSCLQFAEEFIKQAGYECLFDWVICL
ncbi:unnamed protein product [Protopolystoma xenopodis]|uniref:Uncharacterized protein n=1 Tax=Protopolystoma xenopodis TaxID=117903 RepID=A0A3S5C4A8_9PLAT|nr:unnamed protein product [Protopolystoma xenopodis]